MDLDELLLRESMDVIGEPRKYFSVLASCLPAMEVRALIVRASSSAYLTSSACVECAWSCSVYPTYNVKHLVYRPTCVSDATAGGVQLHRWMGVQLQSPQLSGAAGRFGFQKDMNAINSLWHPASEANHNVRALLGSTEEVVARTKTFCRWFQLWRADPRHGWTILGRFKARALRPSPQRTRLYLCLDHGQSCCCGDGPRDTLITPACSLSGDRWSHAGGQAKGRQPCLA